jgi:hypothetical protein
LFLSLLQIEVRLRIARNDFGCWFTHLHLSAHLLDLRVLLFETRSEGVHALLLVRDCGFQFRDRGFVLRSIRFELRDRCFLFLNPVLLRFDFAVLFEELVSNIGTCS